MTTSAVPARSRVRRAMTSAAVAPYRIAALALAGTVADVAVDPQHTHVPLCPFHSLTGLQCPLCGSLRAVNALVRGHPGAALRDNVLLVAALPVAVVVWVGLVRTAPAERRPLRWSPRAVAGIVAVLVVFTVVRNLPFATWLRP